MQITIDTETASNLELLALSALIGVLSGRDSTVAPHPAALIAARYGTEASMAYMNGEQRINDALNPVDHSDQDVETVNAAVAAGAPTHDSAGVPWDERIHSASRATVADGTWRKRRGVPDETYEAVTAELTAGNVPAPLLGADTPMPSPEPSETPAPPAPSEPVATATPVVAAAPAADVPPPPAEGAIPAGHVRGPNGSVVDITTFPKFVQAVNGKTHDPVTNKPIDASARSYTKLNELCATFGVAAFKDMKDRPNDWEMFYEMVG